MLTFRALLFRARDELPRSYREVTGENQPLLKLPLDKVMLVKHANKKDTWVIGHAWDSAYYSAFLVTDEK